MEKLYLKNSDGLFSIAPKQTVCETATIYALNDFKRQSNALGSPQKMRELLRCYYANAEREIFAIFLLDNQNRLIAVETLFYGTINAANIYPREVVKTVLANNAQAVIFAHNHPSGDATPSKADRDITSKLTNILGLIDVKVLDHFVVGEEIVSFAEKGMI